MKKVLFALVGVAIAALVAYTVFFDKESAPEVSYTSLTGQTATTSSLKGKVVLVNFWATSCTGCVAEMAKLKATHERYAPQGYETVAVAMSYDPPNYVKAFVSDNQLPFFVTLDTNGTIAKAFGDIQLAPTTFLIDKHGKVIKRYVGEPNFAELRGLIEQALKA